MSQVDIIMGESVIERGWKDIKIHPDSTLMSDIDDYFDILAAMRQ